MTDELLKTLKLFQMNDNIFLILTLSSDTNSQAPKYILQRLINYDAFCVLVLEEQTLHLPALQ